MVLQTTKIIGGTSGLYHCANALFGLNQTQGRQLEYGLTQGIAADLEAAGQFILGRQNISLLQTPAGDPLVQDIKNFVGGRAALYRLCFGCHFSPHHVIKMEEITLVLRFAITVTYNY